jgi:uncharacterized membrane protein HdeD (DUF308 family)
MKKQLPVSIYGAMIIIVGFFMLFQESFTFNLLKSFSGTMLITASIIAFVAALTRQRKHTQFAYHELHALAMLGYGIWILLFSNTEEKLITTTSFLFIFYTFSEIIFSIWLFNLKQKVVFKIVLLRVFLGLITGIGVVIAMNYTKSTLEIFGILFIIVGINIILYIPVMKGSSENDKLVGV